MRGLLQRFGFAALLSIGVAAGGINRKAVWLEPQNVVIVNNGEKQPYTVMGLNGANVTANLTRSPYLKIESSDPDVLEVDRKNGMFIGKKPGHTEVHISFSEATAIVKAVVR